LRGKAQRSSRDRQDRERAHLSLHNRTLQQDRRPFASIIALVGLELVPVRDRRTAFRHHKNARRSAAGFRPFGSRREGAPKGPEKAQKIFPNQ
jgi:hypothetical protein